MKALTPHLFKNGSILDPARVNENWQRIIQDSLDCVARRYHRTTGSLVWHSLTNTSTVAERTIKLSPPAACEIVGIEVHVFGTAGEVCTVTITVAGSTVWTGTVTCVSATSIASFFDGVSIPVAASAAVEVVISGDAAFTFDRTTVGLALRHDRHTGNEPAVPTYAAVASGNTTAATAQDNAETAVDSAMDDDEANTDGLRFTFIRGPTGVAAAWTAANYTADIPDGGAKVNKFEAHLVAANTEQTRFALLDDAAVSLSSFDITGTGTTTTASDGEGSLGDVQNAGDPTSTANDWTVVFTSLAGAATNLSSYVIIWWV